MISDYEDDDHYCIKCHLTIGGLENYIQHRKAHCAKTMVVAPKSPLPSQLLAPDESFGLKADDFFSSLELQSSNKKQPMPSTSGKTFSGVLTRSKTSAVIHLSAASGGGGTQRDVDVQQSKSGKHSWIGGHQLKELGTGDNQTKLIKAVDNLSRSACLKKYEPPTDAGLDVDSYNDALDEESDEYDYDDDEEDDEEVPRSHTGGNWAPEWSYSSLPPANHTGGKWRPPKAPPQNHTMSKWQPGSPHEVNVPPPSYTRGKWKPANPKESDQHDAQLPPPTYTKGKWRPASDDRKEEQSEEPRIKKRAIDEIPPFRKSNGSVQYWCNPCNRQLSSKIVYERHLRSELHFKRTLHEAEFDDTAATTATTATTAPTSEASATHLNTNRDKEAKRTIRKPVEYWSHTGAPSENNKDPRKNTAAASAGPVADDVLAGSATSVTTSYASVTTTAAPPATATATMTMAAPRGLAAARRRIRRKIYAKCEVCLARVTSQMMGKHLISHYHCRKGDITRPAARQMVLDNIHAVVLQSPYQCGACNFYCNTHDYFLRHWRTADHVRLVMQNGGVLTCTFCKFSCAENNTMYKHLVSPEHEEVISVINRSVPIVIRNVTPIECATCQESFSLNIQLRQHCMETHHQLSHTATDEYQRKKHCEICRKVFNSTIALQRHLKTHNAKMFFCTRCNVEFSTAEEIAKHRTTTLHKQKQPAFKKCEYCKSAETFDNMHQLKTHLQTHHPEHSYDCPHCGRKFTFAQELTVHVRSKTCLVSPKTELQKPHKCERCVFSCDTLSELIFHQILHDEPLRIENSKQPYYKCSLCEKFYPKSSLRYHIQNHTNEKLYKCTLCDARFARKNNWRYHLKKHEHKDHIRRRSSQLDKEKNFLCATCGAKFSNNATLKKHMVVHNGKQFKCAHPGCIHMARTPADLSAHQRSTHSTEMSFRCDRCDYRGKSKQHLKRHATIHEYVKKYQCSRCSFTCRLAFQLRRHERIHTGSKPFACPHCEYRCNNLENLRKHVLSTNKHPDKCIYECKFCDTDAQFAGNFAKDFKAHLLAAHGDVFGSVGEAASYIAGIYDSIEDAASAVRTSAADAPKTSAAAGALHKANKINPTMLDAVVGNEAAAATLIPPAETTFETKGHHQEELFPMYVIAKDDVVYFDKESWCMVGNFGVEESGGLVSFSVDADAEPLFQEHFQ